LSESCGKAANRLIASDIPLPSAIVKLFPKHSSVQGLVRVDEVIP
jgi:hypothetical protein